MQVRKRESARGIRLSELRTEERERLCVRSDWDEVLGGGLRESSIVLVSGSPGSGKTSDMLAIASMAGTQAHPSLYISSEWKPPELAARARELGLDRSTVVAETVSTLEDAEEAIALSRARTIVLDSWGNLFPVPPAEGLDRLRAAMGAATLLVILHATKLGEFSGEERLLHKADALIWVEPQVLRCIKNWHGPPEIEVRRLEPAFLDRVE
jgi:DNA repair protein RadA/Sms